MKLFVKNFHIILMVVFGLLGSLAFGQTVQEKTLFYGEKITGLQISSFFDVAVLKGDDNYLKLEYDPIFEKNIETSISNGVLILKLKGDVKCKCKNKSGTKMVLKAIVCVSDLKQVITSGAVDVHFVGTFTPKEISIINSGSSDLIGLNCQTETISLISSGATDIKDFKISSKKAVIQLSGSSDLKNAVLEAEDLQLILTGASDISDLKHTGNNAFVSISGSSDISKSTLQTSVLNLQLSGASSCNIFGKSTKADISSTGSSEASMRDFEIETLDAILSGASSGTFKVNKNLSFVISSCSNLNIYGNPHVQKSTSSGNSTVHYY